MPESHQLAHELEQDQNANAGLRWVIGLGLSGLLTTIQDWLRRRGSDKKLAALKEEIKQELQGPNDPKQRDELREMLSDLQQTISEQGKRQDDRHAANLVRFANIEERQRGFGDDLRQGRAEVEGLREDTRHQTALLQTVLANILALREKN